MPKVKLKPIKIELELQPETALLLATFIHRTAQGDLSVYRILADNGIEDLVRIAQLIVDQVAEKTEFHGIDLEKIPDEDSRNIMKLIQKLGIELTEKKGK